MVNPQLDRIEGKIDFLIAIAGMSDEGRANAIKKRNDIMKLEWVDKRYEVDMDDWNKRIQIWKDRVYFPEISYLFVKLTTAYNQHSVSQLSPYQAIAFKYHGKVIEIEISEAKKIIEKFHQRYYVNNMNGGDALSYAFDNSILLNHLTTIEMEPSQPNRDKLAEEYDKKYRDEAINNDQLNYSV